MLNRMRDLFCKSRLGFACLALVAFILPLITVLALPYDVPNKFIFAILLGLLSSALFFTYISPGKCIRLSIKLNFKLVFCIIYTISIAFILTGVLHDPNISIVSSNLLTLTLYQTVLLISTLLISFFLPGYAFTKMLKVTNQLWMFERAAFVILSSIAITAFIGFITWVLGSITDLGLIITGTVNIAILVIYVVLNSKDLRISKAQVIEVSYKTHLIFLLILVFCMVSFFSIHNIQGTLPIYGDELDHVKLIVKFLNGYYSWQEQALNILSTPNYPYFLHLFEGVGVVLSKLPVSSYYLISSLFLIPLPLLSFIPLANSLTNGNRNVTILSAIIFQLFSGFGWLYAVNNYSSISQIGTILSSSTSTGDIIYSTWFPTITAPYLIDLSVFLFALNFSLKRDVSIKKSLIILTPLLITGFFVHIEKTIFLSGLVFLLFILQFVTNSKKFHIKSLNIALIITCLSVLAIDLIAPKQLLITTYFTSTILILSLNILTLILSLILPKIRLFKLKEFIITNVRSIIILGIIAFFFAIVFELCSQVKPLDNFLVVPLYFLPIKLGIAGLFALVCLLSVSRDNLSKNGPLLLLLSAVFILEFFLYHGSYPIYSLTNSYVEEFRFIRDISWPLIAIAGSIGISITIMHLLKSSFKGNKLNKSNFLAVLLFVVLIGFLFTGTFSNLLKIEYSTSIASNTDSTIMSIAEFMANQSVPTGSAIYAPSSIGRILGSVTGAVIYTPDSMFYGNLLSKSSDYLSTLFILEYLNISFVITSESDSSHLTQLIKYYPIIYHENSYTIYSITGVSSPSLHSSTAILSSNSRLSESLFEYSLNGAITWKDEFSNTGGWKPDNSTFTNVHSYSATGTNDNMIIQASGNSGSKIVMFYKHSLSTPIIVENGLNVFLKFKTDPGTALIVHVLYSDGTQNNLVYDNSVYMQSSTWASSDTELESGKTVIGFRIGISNVLIQSYSTISANIDYLIVYSSSEKSTQFVDTLTSLSLADINYTIAYQLESIHSSGLSTIISVDQSNFPDETSEDLLELVQNGSNLIIIGDLSASSYATKFGNVTLTSNAISATKIQCVSTFYKIPSTPLQELSVSNCEVLANYSDGVTSVPLLVKFSNGIGSIYYCNLLPLLDSSNLTNVSSNEIQKALQAIYHDCLSLSYSSIDQRLFYLKNYGSTIFDGKVDVSFTDLILGNSPLVEKIIQGNDCALNVIGSVKLLPFDLGYNLLSITGKVSVIQDGVIIYESTVTDLPALIKSELIGGNGNITFASLSSSYPYNTYSDIVYKNTGDFSLYMIPLSNNLLFIYPDHLGDFED